MPARHSGCVFDSFHARLLHYWAIEERRRPSSRHAAVHAHISAMFERCRPALGFFFAAAAMPCRRPPFDAVLI